MQDFSPTRHVSRTGPTGLAPYFTALMMAAALLFVWAGLCAI
jgi:hypothetical protein